MQSLTLNKMVEQSDASGSLDKKAKKAFKAGQAALKTGLFKWYADYVEAAVKFEQAAKLSKATGDNAKAVEAYVLFSQCSEKSNEMSGAAEGMTEAAWLSKDVD